LITLALAILVAQDRSGDVRLNAGRHQARVTRAAADSATVVRRARAAQSDFERWRRNNLPLTSSPSAGRCDVRIGRFCYWYDADDAYHEESQGPPEPKRIADARERLIGSLDAAAQALPGDSWIARQRVRYLVEHGRAADALEVAQNCGGEAWWCSALAGFSLHASGAFGASDSAFAVALAGMPDAERCRWSNISVLLSGKRAKRYKDAPCADRARLERRFWALARPLYALDGNDLRTEHFARLTMARLLRDARTPHAMPWGDDMQELLVRFGWERRWARTEPRPADPTTVNVVGFEPSPAYEFSPTDDAFFDPAHAEEDGWDLKNRVAQARYAPAYARSLVPLAHQLAFFRRGDSAIVVAAFDAESDSGFARDSLRAAVAVIADSSDSAVVVRLDRATRTERLRVSAPWSAAVVSVELVDSAHHRVARARHSAGPDEVVPNARLAISDLLLLERPDSLPTILDDAVPLARGSDRARVADRLGVFWEVYGIDAPNDTLAYTVTVTPTNESWLHRAVRRVGIGDRPAPLHMRWEEPVTGGAPVARSLALDLSGLAPGRYQLEVTADATATARRIITVAR
jgi:hypothetical protein